MWSEHRQQHDQNYMTERPYILGIETSCDETAAAIYHPTRGMVANALFSQIALHRAFGGVVPEIASRSQLEKITPIVREALDQAGVTLSDIGTIAVTHKPGLPGSLLVGLCFAKALAWASGAKLVGVNHLEGHVFSSLIEHEVPFPHLCLTASGGHTSLYLVEGWGNYTMIGTTLDDAAGEAFDKVAKLMHLPYPGGPEIEKLATAANFIDTRNYPRSRVGEFDFSFSGIKTAVLYDLVNEGAYDMQAKRFLAADDTRLIQEVASSLLVCVGDIFRDRIVRALKKYPHVQAVTFVGGVACNRYLRGLLADECKKRQRAFFTPSPQFCTDNGAMIARVGAHKASEGLFTDWNLDIF